MALITRAHSRRRKIVIKLQASVSVVLRAFQGLEMAIVNSYMVDFVVNSVTLSWAYHLFSLRNIQSLWRNMFKDRVIGLYSCEVLILE